MTGLPSERYAVVLFTTSITAQDFTHLFANILHTTQYAVVSI